MLRPRARDRSFLIRSRPSLSPPGLQGFPGGAGFLAAAAFHLGLAAICGLYCLFWLRLTLLQTLPALIGLGVFTAGAGGSTLRRLAAEQGSGAAAKKAKKQE